MFKKKENKKPTGSIYLVLQPTKCQPQSLLTEELSGWESQHSGVSATDGSQESPKGNSI